MLIIHLLELTVNLSVFAPGGPLCKTETLICETVF
jgi:hypothetical protein